MYYILIETSAQCTLFLHSGLNTRFYINNKGVIKMIFEKVKEIIADKIEIDPDKITMESSFEDLQIDSLDMVEIIMDLEDAFDVNLDTEEEIKTVEDLIRFIEAAQ